MTPTLPATTRPRDRPAAITGLRFAAGCVAVAVAFAPASRAAEPVLGPYVGAGGGQSMFRSNLPGQIESAYAGSGLTVESASVTDDKDGAWKVYAGWRVHRYAAVELGYLDFGRATTHYDIGVPFQGIARRDGRYELTGIELSGVGILPIADRWAVFAKAGALFSRLEYDETGVNQFSEPASFSHTNRQTRFLWGLGGSFDVTDALSARLEWQRVEKPGKTFALDDSGNGRFDQVDLFSLNVQWQFR